MLSVGTAVGNHQGTDTAGLKLTENKLEHEANSSEDFDV
jgi:hypothetical protein